MTAEQVLKLLCELYAKQYGLELTVRITKGATQ